MAEIASAFVSLLPSAKGFGPKLESEVGGEIKGSGKKLGAGFGKVFAAAGGALAAVGISKFLGEAVGDARESQKISALTEQVIKTTGGAAKVTATQVQDLAGSIAEKTGVDDAAIQSASNLLLTFTNLRNEVGKGNDIFNQATQIATDMGAALGTEPKAAAIQLGKALNDPIKGVGALSRVGVSFTEQQKKVIESLVETGDTAGAQKIILAELNKEFGGAAEAQATAADKAAFAFGELKEQIGTALLPVIDALASAFLKAAPSIAKFIDGIGPAFNQAIGFVQPFIDQFLGFFSSSGGQSALSGIKSFAGSVTDSLLPILQAAATTFTTKVLPAAKALADYFISNLSPIISKYAEIIRNDVLPMIQQLAIFFYTKAYPAVIALATVIAQKLKPVFDTIFQVIQTSILPTLQMLLAKFREYQPEINKLVTRVATFVGALLKVAAAILAKVLPPAIRFAGFIISKLVPALATIIGTAVKVINKIITFGTTIFNAGKRVFEFQRDVAQAFREIVSKVTDNVASIVKAVTSIPGKIRNVASKFLEAGKDIMSKIFEGIKSGASGVAGFIADIAQSIKDAINNALNLPFKIKGPGPLPDFTIPAFAKGGTMKQAGAAWVGERGPELVYLNKGAVVKTAAESRQIARNPIGGAALREGVSAGANRTMVLRVGDREFVGYMSEIADSRVDTAAGMSAERSRATWSR